MLRFHKVATDCNPSEKYIKNFTSHFPRQCQHFQKVEAFSPQKLTQNLLQNTTTTSLTNSYHVTPHQNAPNFLSAAATTNGINSVYGSSSCSVSSCDIKSASKSTYTLFRCFDPLRFRFAAFPDFEVFDVFDVFDRDVVVDELSNEPSSPTLLSTVNCCKFWRFSSLIPVTDDIDCIVLQIA